MRRVFFVFGLDFIKTLVLIKKTYDKNRNIYAKKHIHSANTYYYVEQNQLLFRLSGVRDIDIQSKAANHEQITDIYMDYP